MARIIDYVMNNEKCREKMNRWNITSALSVINLTCPCDYNDENLNKIEEPCDKKKISFEKDSLICLDCWIREMKENGKDY